MIENETTNDYISTNYNGAKKKTRCVPIISRNGNKCNATINRLQDLVNVLNDGYIPIPAL